MRPGKSPQAIGFAIVSVLRFGSRLMTIAAFRSCRIAPGTMFACTFVLLLGSLAACRRPVPSGMAKYTSFAHELRCLLARAERENFINGVRMEDGDAVIHHPVEIAAVTPPSQIAFSYFKVSLFEQFFIQPNPYVVDLSSVRNL